MDGYISWKQALDAVKDTNEILVGRDDYIQRWNYRHILHVVLDCNYNHTEYKAYTVEIDRPSYLYGGEGILFSSGLRYLGRLEDEPDDETELITDETWEFLPDTGPIWAFKDTATAYAKEPILWKRMPGGIQDWKDNQEAK